MAITNLNIGLLILFAITSMGVYGVALAGWSSNSKYSLLGGLRSSAQMVSYELALTMSVVGVILMAGTFNLSEIVTSQQGFHWGFVPRWNLIGSPMPQVLGFLLFFTAAVAETNRAPFDLAEAESELVAGFHTEYASFKFAMFFMAEYSSMITVSCLATILVFWRMAVTLSADRALGLDALHSHGGVRAGGPGADRSRRALYHGLDAVVLPSWAVVLCGLAVLCSRPGVIDLFRAILVSVEDSDFSFRVRLGARHASPIPVRPIDEFRLESAAAAFDLECGDYESGDCIDAAMSFERATA
jgi:hypothetical protein